MKFTSEDLMKAMGLKVGDRIRCNKLVGTVFEIIKMDNGSIALDGLQAEWYSIHELIDKEIEILPQPKRVGDLKCDDYKYCELKGVSCPLKAICSGRVMFGKIQDTLFETLKHWEEDETRFDQEIYDILKARLDKEVKENERLD